MMADQWFGVRCIFRHTDLGAYEERVTVWEVPTFDDAIAAAKADAAVYEGRHGSSVEFVGITQTYQTFEVPAHGADVFSLMRDSELDPTA